MLQQRIINYFNRSYQNQSALERQKIDYIILTNIALAMMFIGVSAVHFFCRMSPVHYYGDLGGIIGVILSLCFIRKGNIQFSSRALLTTLSIITVIFGVAVDLLANSPVHFLRIYVSLFCILGIYIIMLNLYSSTTNFKAYSGLFSVFLLLHMIVIVYHNGGVSTITLEMTSYFIIAIVGTILAGHICANMSEITHRLNQKMIEDSERIQQFNIELNKIVELQTKDLRESNERLQKFAHVVSHDIKEPIRTISSFISLVKRKLNIKYPEDDSLEDDFKMITISSKRINDLINDMLSFAKVSKSNEAYTDIDMNKLIKNVLKNLIAIVTSKRAQISYDSLHSIIGQENLIFQVFLNLISNSIRYSRPDISPEIKIESKIKDQSIIIILQDNGIGIPKNMLEKIFIPYQQIHTGASADGIGMGLSICKNIVDYHGGEIWVESVVGAGSTFYLKFPNNAKQDGIASLTKSETTVEDQAGLN